ncbi:metallophosphoesterase family protein [Pseudooceanicola sp. 200-1SW]|uniref:metallophosphoesterase family protein n=1 Tax=Pseudooceanicola sp. 200-1SW TaxID=3425949 RepID=UPI003D7FE337
MTEPPLPLASRAPLPDRFAVLADIHGNSAALRAVLADLEALGDQAPAPGAVLVLGDHFSGPLDAGGTAELLLPLSAQALRGNHDRYLLETPPDHLGPSDWVARAELPAAAFDWLAAQPRGLDFGDVQAWHATPRADDRYWTHHATTEGGVALRPPEEMAAQAAGTTAALLLTAHTHLPGLWALPTGQLLLNPGSVGCPAYRDEAPMPHVVTAGHPLASYALVTRRGMGWAVAHRHVPYDSAEMAARARDHGREDWARAVELGSL